MAKQTMEGRRFAKRQFAVCAGLTAGAAALNGWELLPFLLPSGAVVLLFELSWRRFKRLGDRREA